MTFIFLSLGRENSSGDLCCTGCVSPKSLGEEHTLLKKFTSQDQAHFLPRHSMQCLPNWGQRTMPRGPPGKGAERTLWEGLLGPLAPSDFTFQKQMILKNKGIYFTIEHKPKFRQKRKKEKKKRPLQT